MINHSFNNLVPNRIWLITFLALFLSIPSLAQPPEAYDEDGNLIITRKKGFTAGLYLGTYFANKASAELYDGYGFDYDGNKRPFSSSFPYESSFMYENINNQYGSTMNGQPDYIAEALGVQHGQWRFDDETFMANNMRYNTAMCVGFSGRYSVDGQNALIINATGILLTAVGNFTIWAEPPPNSTQVNEEYRTYEIRGKEQRILFQLGYQHLFGESQTFNFLAEGGLHGTLCKFTTNEIQIEELHINLLSYYYDPISGYTYDTGLPPVGFGLGAFAGFGFNLDMSNHWLLQLVYDLTLENVTIDYNDGLGINHSAGLRMYYKFLARN